MIKRLGRASCAVSNRINATHLVNKKKKSCWAVKLIFLGLNCGVHGSFSHKSKGCKSRVLD